MRRLAGLWPRSLAARTAVLLLAALVTVQVAGLSIDALDRLDLARLAQVRNISIRLSTLFRAVASAPRDDRAEALRAIALPPEMRAQILPKSPLDTAGPLPLAPEELRRALHVAMLLVPMPPWLRPDKFVVRGDFPRGRLLIGMRLPNQGGWLTVSVRVPPPLPWHSPGFLGAFVLMTVVAALLTVWAVRRLTEPVRTLAAAAERLGRDVNAPPLAEDGPAEVATAAAAFNTMAARIRRFVDDRTFLLTAIGHDLRTPITRLKLRAEFVEDEEQRRKILADLDELETMVAATLDFGRDATASEPVAPVDLALLCQTVIDEAGDVRPEAAERLAYSGPLHLTARARITGLKRALGNLVGNAIAYGGGARLTLVPPQSGLARIEIEDDGPGIPPTDLERVFQPFQRLEASRNRETGGSGLGLPIARNILRAHGGDVTLVNRASGGATAVVTLPV
ncbi:MAG TPA: HAMP domain-containing sensor histidine kinase [Acetobacteraceae bacterium]|nr:HAMP domain-containing sensor histidine kinase [Acetobacteraceae bacterium]